MAKSVFITGASSGIGKALAFEFAKRGYSLALTARRQQVLEELQKDLQQKYPAIVVEIRSLDVTDMTATTQVLRESARILNGIDIVIANAGIGLSGKIGCSDFNNARKTIETNLIGGMATTDAAVAYFLERGQGHVVGISSIAAFRGFSGNSSYCASKAGLSVYLEALRGEVQHKNIHVTVLYPGFIDTPLNDMLKSRPFVIPVDKGAQLIAQMIERKVTSSTVPVMPWGLIGSVLKWLPASIVLKM